jgi:hypothetical protein
MEDRLAYLTCGTGGFLTDFGSEVLDWQVKTFDDKEPYNTSIYGISEKYLAVLFFR